MGFREPSWSVSTSGTKCGEHSRPAGLVVTLGGFRPLLRIGLLCCLFSALWAGSCYARCYSILPSSLSLAWGRVAVGVVSSGQGVTVTNTCSMNLKISSFSLAPLQFQLVDGIAPKVLGKGDSYTYYIKFAPNAAGTFTGQISFTISGVGSPVDVSLSGIGFVTTAKASVTPLTLSFPNRPLGVYSPAQTVTVTNVGGANLTVQSVSVDVPFSLKGFTNPVTLGPGNSLSLQVEFFAQAVATFTSTMVVSMDVLPPVGVSLSGNGKPNRSLAITSFHLLPTGTQGYPYLAQLLSSGGQGAVSWSVASGGLPMGLSLSSEGTISGTLASSAKLRGYHFTVQVTDSGENTASANMTLIVEGPTGANCNNIFWDIVNTSTPITPISDLGTGTYLGAEGGLYPNGSNVRPAGHDADGVALAQAIQPLDANGNPDPDGAYVLLSVGMSAAHSDSVVFFTNAQADPTKNPHLVFVNGAQNTAVAKDFADPNSPFWNSIFEYFMPQAGVTANQVVAAYIEETDTLSGSFPGDIKHFYSDLVSVAQNLHSKFPNLKLAYVTGRFYTGYGNNLPGVIGQPEPYGYESGFGVKDLIADQLNRDPALNYDPGKGPVMAPWLSWGPYMWANGMLARSDGLFYTCQDRQPDGNHPSTSVGREKDANQILNFFKTDDTAQPWFLAK